MALDSAVLLDYPIRVAHRVAGADRLAEQAGWIQAGTGELLVTRPPAPHELAALPAKIRGLRVTAARARQQGDNRKDVETLLTALQQAGRDIARLTTCPVCAHSPARLDRVLQNWGDGNYRCECESCASAWEVRQCTNCEQRYPVLLADGSSGEVGGGG